MSSRDMCLLPRATLHSDSEQLVFLAKGSPHKGMKTDTTEIVSFLINMSTECLSQTCLPF
jgi:hypothetical protein